MLNFERGALEAKSPGLTCQNLVSILHSKDAPLVPTLSFKHGEVWRFYRLSGLFLDNAIMPNAQETCRAICLAVLNVFKGL